MRLEHVVPQLHRQASGLATSVPALANALASLGHSVTVHMLEPNRAISGVNTVAYKAWRFPARLGVSPDMKAALSEAARSSDVVHAHSLWTMPTVYPSQQRREARASFVMSPHGTLDPKALEISRIRKRAAWLLGQRNAIQKADLIHATSDSELDAIRRVRLDKPVAVIANGVEVPSLTGETGKEAVVLYLGRIHEQKRIENLVDAWSLLDAAQREWRLRIVGPADRTSYVASLRRQVRDLRLRNVEFAPPAFGAKRLEEYRRAAVLVLPTATENFGMVVAEALAAGTPVIVTKGAPWSGLREHGCGWWVDHGARSIASALDEAMRLDISELSKMGMKGRMWMEKDFSWERAGRQMAACYGWLSGLEDRPECVVVP